MSVCCLGYVEGGVEICRVSRAVVSFYEFKGIWPETVVCVQIGCSGLRWIVACVVS